MDPTRPFFWKLRIHLPAFFHLYGKAQTHGVYGVDSDRISSSEHENGCESVEETYACNLEAEGWD